MTFLLKEQIRIGISACNFGALVRWNGRGWNRTAGLGREKDGFIWTPVCPEVNGGLGVRRDPIRLVGGNGDDFWAGNARIKNRKGKELTKEMKDGSMKSLDILRRADIEAFVFMEGSPSCGVYRTTLKERRLGKPPGIFGALLLREDYFLIPAVDLESPVKWWDWRRRLHAFAWLKRERISSKKQIYDIWHLFKFLCQEVDVKRAAEMGRSLAAMPRSFAPSFAEQWRSDVLMLLRLPSTIGRIHSIMLKHFAHYRKHFNPSAREVKAPRTEMAKHAFVKELMEMEKRALLEGYDFGGTPVIYRSER